MITFRLSGEQAAIAALKGRQTQLLSAFARTIDLLDTELQQHIQRDLLSGQVLNQRTGKLKRSIEIEPAKIDGSTVTGAVHGAGGPAWYGRLHEFGTTESHVVVPVNKQALSWMADGKRVFAMRAVIPPLPVRSFMRRGQNDMRDRIYTAMQATAERVLSARP